MYARLCRSTHSHTLTPPNTNTNTNKHTKLKLCSVHLIAAVQSTVFAVVGAAIAIAVVDGGISFVDRIVHVLQTENHFTLENGKIGRLC